MWAMSPIDVLRSRRSLDDLPAASTDEELLAWGEALAGPQPVRRRTEPLRAAGVVATPDGPMSIQALIAEIEQRTA
jgi:hypothetical protein